MAISRSSFGPLTFKSASPVLVNVAFVNRAFGGIHPATPPQRDRPDLRASTEDLAPSLRCSRWPPSGLLRTGFVILTHRIFAWRLARNSIGQTMKPFLAYISGLLNECRTYLDVTAKWMAVPLRILADILILTLVTLVVVLALYLLAAYLITRSKAHHLSAAEAVIECDGSTQGATKRQSLESRGLPIDVGQGTFSTELPARAKSVDPLRPLLNRVES
jgi:hypothetical protein